MTRIALALWLLLVTASAAHAQTTPVDVARPLLALAIAAVVAFVIWRLAPG